MRYTRRMNLSLPPDLQRLVHDHLIAGGFHSEAEVLRTALHMLEVQSPKATVTPDAVRSSVPPANLDQQASTAVANVRRSPRGMLADLASHISPDEIAEARAEMWSRFPGREA